MTWNDDKEQHCSETQNENIVAELQQKCRLGTANGRTSMSNEMDL